MEICHLRRQWAVGQGSFHSASISIKSSISDEMRRFDYVYDCGGLSNRKITQELRSAVKMYRPRVDSDTGEFTLDAMVISHFDRDHMNGCELIAGSTYVKKIFVPYISEELLITEIARSAAEWSEELLRDLFELVHKRTLWGRQVVFVLPGRHEDGGDTQISVDAPIPTSTNNPQSNLVEAVLSSSGSPPKGSMKDTEDLIIHFQGEPVWRLRFWNQSSSKEQASRIAESLAKKRFPLAALKQPNGAATVLKWLKQKSNRDSAVKAYETAILESTTTTGVERKNISNYISLAMFSGPIQTIHFDYSWKLGSSELWWALNWELRKVRYKIPHNAFGWLGTGDALLGEPSTWKDFSQHFRAEQSQILSVLLPHHGAAPKTGARYYNAGLNYTAGIVSILSYGKDNTYGHPTSAVTDAVLLSGGHLRLVDENAAPYFLEQLMTRNWN